MKIAASLFSTYTVVRKNVDHEMKTLRDSALSKNTQVFIAKMYVIEKLWILPRYF